MTSTPVTSMGSSLYGLPGSSAAQSQSKSMGFGSVMSQAQTANQSNTSYETNASDKTSKKVSDPISDRTSDQISESDHKVNHDTDKIEAETSSGISSEAESAVKTDAETAEAVEEAAEEMVSEIADELGMSEEDVLAAMETLGLQFVDLLNQDSLRSLITQLTGEGDLLALTTNEDLYMALQNLTATMNELVNGIQEQFSLTDEEMQQLLSQLRAAQGQETTQEVAHNDTFVTELAQQMQGAEENLTTHQVQNEFDAEPETDELDQAAQQTMQDADGTEQVTEQNADGQNANEQNANEQNAAKDFAANQNNGDGQNLFQMNQEQTVTHVNGESVVTAYGEVNPSSIMRQITEYMSLQTREGLTEMEMQLNPANLGTIHLSLTAKAGAIAATLTAQNEAVKNVLESQIMIVRENLENQGIKVEAVEVTVASHAFEHNLNDGNESDTDNDTEPTSKKRSIRRLDLNDPEIEGMEMDEEEQLTREVMKMNGNTVDYTA